MIKFVLHCFLLFTIIGCVDKSNDLKTFDYKSMKIIKSNSDVDKSFWIEPIKIDKNRIALNVIYRGKNTKRVFDKVDDFWYSELNYRYPLCILNN